MCFVAFEFCVPWLFAVTFGRIPMVVGFGIFDAFSLGFHWMLIAIPLYIRRIVAGFLTFVSFCISIGFSLNGHWGMIFVGFGVCAGVRFRSFLFDPHSMGKGVPWDSHWMFVIWLYVRFSSALDFVNLSLRCLSDHHRI